MSIIWVVLVYSPVTRTRLATRVYQDYKTAQRVRWACEDKGLLVCTLWV